MPSEPIEISYRTTIEVPREGFIGNLLRWLGDHPIWGGLICGVIVVVVAAIRQPGGVSAAPTTAALISLAVIIVWMVLFFLMRRFFEAQSFATENVLRKLTIDDEQAAWLQDDEPTRQIDNPRLRILTNPVPEALSGQSDTKKTAWPVWIVIDNADDDSDDRLVFETREPARRAREYDTVSNDIIEQTDERLPRAIASSILQRFTDPATA